MQSPKRWASTGIPQLNTRLDNGTIQLSRRGSSSRSHGHGVAFGASRRGWGSIRKNGQPLSLPRGFRPRYLSALSSRKIFRKLFGHRHSGCRDSRSETPKCLALALGKSSLSFRTNPSRQQKKYCDFLTLETSKSPLSGGLGPRCRERSVHLSQLWSSSAMDFGVIESRSHRRIDRIHN